MECRDAQFYLRLRRHAGDELGAEVSTDLSRHLVSCTTCAALANTAESFDRAVAAAVGNVPVPAGLRDRLFAEASAFRGGVIRRQVYRVSAVAASVLLALGIGFGAFFANRPKIDTSLMVMAADQQIQDPDATIRQWLIEHRFPDRLPEPFNPELLMSLGTERVQGADVPVVVFRHPDGPGFAKVYIFATNGTVNLDNLRVTNASHTIAEVIADPLQFRGVKYVIVHTVHPVGPHENPLKPFLRPGRDVARS